MDFACQNIVKFFLRVQVVDLAQFFKLAVSMPWEGFHCLNAASRPLDQERLSLEEAKDLLGYEPVDQWPDAVEAYWP